VPDINVAGQNVPGSVSPSAVHARSVTTNYFSAMQTPVIVGRDFNDADMAQHLRVVVINQEFVRRFLAGVSPLGQRVTMTSGGTENLDLEIVGIVRDARIFGNTAGSQPEMYIPFSVAPYRGFYIVVETSGDPLLIAGPTRTIVRALAPEAVITNVQTMDQLLLQSVAQPRFNALLLGMLAGLALLLALAGIYAVMSYSVTQRRHEMGVRAALGARTGNILALVLRSSLRLALCGLIIGLPAAFAVSRTLTALLYGVAPTDPRSYVASAAVLLALALAAAFAPAVRATRVNPIDALRTE
jgi:putative ABC transport system permease protein